MRITRVIQNLFCSLLTLHAYLVRLTVNRRLVYKNAEFLNVSSKMTQKSLQNICQAGIPLRLLQLFALANLKQELEPYLRLLL